MKTETKRENKIAKIDSSMFTIVLAVLLVLVFIANVIILVNFNRSFTKEGTLSYINGTGNTLKTRFVLPIGYEICDASDDSIGDFLWTKLPLKPLGSAAHNKDGEKIEDVPLGAIIDWQPEDEPCTDSLKTIIEGLYKDYAEEQQTDVCTICETEGIHPGLEMDGGVILAVAKHKTDETKPTVVLIGKMSEASGYAIFVANNTQFVLNDKEKIDTGLRNYYGSYWCPIIEESE